MDISGPVRNLLRRLTQGAAPSAGGGATGETDPLRLLVRAVARPEEEIAGLPRFLAADAPLLAGGAGPAGAHGGRDVYGLFGLAGALRLLPRVRRGDRGLWREGLRRQVTAVVTAGQRLLVSRTTPAVAYLWHHYLLMLAGKRAGIDVPEILVKGLWRRGVGGQSAAGHLHPLTAETVVETFTYDELCGLHAGYNAVAMPGGEELAEPLERMVKWHVENTQPDHSTQEPWALAAFAALDDTGTFAGQQIHDARTQLEGGKGDPRIMLALLADAVLTQEEGAG